MHFFIRMYRIIIAHSIWKEPIIIQICNGFPRLISFKSVKKSVLKTQEIRVTIFSQDYSAVQKHFATKYAKK